MKALKTDAMEHLVLRAWNAAWSDAWMQSSQATSKQHAANIPDLIMKGDDGNRMQQVQLWHVCSCLGPWALKNPGYEVDVCASMCELWMIPASKSIQAFYILSPNAKKCG